ncbi:hypothetical protein B0H13DRAFT_1891050 [Mycena leptocephala]|nr:hypothetical protein B0H13DRAFT_1891050 [Mycena leptocephala]
MSAKTHTLVLFTLIFALGAALTTAVDRPRVHLHRPRLSGIVGGVARVRVGVQSQGDYGRGGVMINYCINYGISLNAKLAGFEAVRVWQIPFGFQLVMLLGLFTAKSFSFSCFSPPLGYASTGEPAFHLPYKAIFILPTRHAGQIAGSSIRNQLSHAWAG